MSRKSVTITEAREQLTRLPDQFAQEQNPEPVTVTRHGEPVLAILPWNLYESLVETLEILSDPETMAQFRASVAALERGERGRELSEVLTERLPDFIKTVTNAQVVPAEPALKDEREWEAIVHTPESQDFLADLRAETLRDIDAGNIEDGGFGE